MERVNLYIETSVHGPAQKGGRCAYVAEYIDRKGDPVVGMSGHIEKKETELALLALYYGLAQAPPFSEVTVYVAKTCAILRSAIDGGWLQRWKKNGWKKANGEDVQHQEVWKAVARRIETRQVNVRIERHPFRDWMQAELKRASANKQVK